LREIAGHPKPGAPTKKIFNGRPPAARPARRRTRPQARLGPRLYPERRIFSIGWSKSLIDRPGLRHELASPVVLVVFALGPSPCAQLGRQRRTSAIQLRMHIQSCLVSPAL